MTLARMLKHRISVYRRTGDGSTWTSVATDVRCLLQPAGGEVEQEGYGRAAERRRHAFAATGADIRPDDGVQVQVGPGVGSRWLVKTADDWGAPGGLEMDLEETGESFV